MGTKTEPFYTRKTLAERLSITTRTLDAMLAHGEIPSYKIGGSRRFDPRDVESYLKERRQA